MRRLRLLCDANPMAYGSSSALLAVLDHLPLAHRTALVHDVSAELLARDSALDVSVSVDVKSPEAVAKAVADLRFDAALVVSNRSNLELYGSMGLPVFFVDILHWYSTAPWRHSIWRQAERSFVQNFPGVEARVATGDYGCSPTVVGPLIRALPARSSSRSGVLINLGGVRSRFIGPSDFDAFLELVHQVVRVLALHEQAITVACGCDAARLCARWSIPGVRVRSFSQVEYLRELANTRVLLTAPGLNAVFEGLSSDVPVLFLPPQNATQVLQLERYEDAGLVPRGLNLFALTNLRHVSEVEDEAAYTLEVLSALRQLVSSPSSRQQVIDHVRRQFGEPAVHLDAGRRFLKALGADGGRTVADAVDGWWRERCSSMPR